MMVDFSPAQIRALRDLLAEHCARPGHTDLYVDPVTDVETTPEELLVIVVLAEALSRSDQIAASVRAARNTDTS